MSYVQNYITYWRDIEGKPFGDKAAFAKNEFNFVAHTMPLAESHPMSDFRSIDEMINEGDEDLLRLIHLSSDPESLSQTEFAQG